MSDGAPRRGLPWAEIRPALAALVIVGGGWWFLSSRMPEPGTRLNFRREGAFQVAGPVANDSGAVLSWTAIPGADRYVVTFSGREMQELARVTVSGETTLVLLRDALPGTLVPGTEALIEVAAFAGDRPLERSLARTVRMP